VRVKVRFRGRFSCQLIIDSRMPFHDPPGSGSGYRFTIHDFVYLCHVAATSWISVRIQPGLLYKTETKTKTKSKPRGNELKHTE